MQRYRLDIAAFFHLRYFKIFLPMKMIRQAPTTEVMISPMIPTALKPQSLNKILPTNPPMIPRIMFLNVPPSLFMMAPAIHPEIPPSMIPMINDISMLFSSWCNLIVFDHIVICLNSDVIF